MPIRAFNSISEIGMISMGKLGSPHRDNVSNNAHYFNLPSVLLLLLSLHIFVINIICIIIIIIIIIIGGCRNI